MSTAPGRHVSFRVNEVPARQSWTIRRHIPRADVGHFCESVRGIVSEWRGASFYYPDVAGARTTCRYEWLRRFERHEFGLRLGIQFHVGSEDLVELEGYAAYGDGHPSKGAVPNFHQRQIPRFNAEISHLINEAIDRLRPEKKKQYHVIFHVEIPQSTKIQEPLAFEEHGILILPTVMLIKEHKAVSAAILTVAASSETEAKGKALRDHMFVCGLLTLAEGSLCKRYSPEWPKNKKPPQLLATLSPYPSPAQIYPAHRWRDYQPMAPTPFSERIRAVLKSYFSLPINARSELDDALFAYFAAQEIVPQQPTLATIALIASLSVFGRAQSCKGNVVCSLCGPLTQFRHNLVSDQDKLVSSLCKLFELDVHGEDGQTLERLIKRVYRTQRSSYVHGATLRHDEYYRGTGIPHAQPTETGVYSEVLSYTLDLRVLEVIARKALLIELSRRAGLAIDSRLFGLDKLPLKPHPGAHASIAIRKDIPTRLL